MSEKAKPEFSIQRIYTKDISFESPKTPQLFSEQWAPEVKMEINTEAKPINEPLYEVKLKVTVTVQQKDSVAFLIEVVQAGLFALKDFEAAQRNQMLGSFCPNILYPYAREVVSNLAAHGGFPALYLSPINFDALYAQHMSKLKEASGQKEIIV
ncbi:MAG: protein-export chaperone SecB [Legionellales bacterium]|jgi:preprotein translocase subunit SecB